MAARAAVRFVSNACPTSGTGAQASCGSSGPFRTIAEGVLAMQPGDTLNVRAGEYFEQITLRSGSTLPGRALACTAAAPCVIQGCRAPACPTDEHPTVRAMRTRADWTSVGSGVYRRVMELSPEVVSTGDQQNTRAGDPLMVMQGTAHPFAMLAYAGDNVTAPPDGRWSFHPDTRTLYVNPTGTADPAAVVQLPHFSYGLIAAAPTAYVTVAHLALEGPRLIGAQWTANPPGMPGIQMRDVQVRYFPRHGVRTTNGAPGVLLEDVTVENGCRGISWALSTGDGCFGLRLFQIHGGTVRRAIVRHMGSAGRRRLSAPSAPTGWPCAWCDAPWNTAQSTEISTTGVGINVKQTDTAVVEDARVEDLSFTGIYLDVSRHATVRRSQARRTGGGYSQRNYTPVTGYTVCYDNFFQDNLAEDADGCGINIANVDTAGRPAGSLLATVERNTIVRADTPICAPSPPPADLVLRDNVISDGTVTTTTTPPSTTLVSTSTSSSSSTSTSRPSTTSTSAPSTTSTRPPTTTSTSSSTSSTRAGTTTSTTLPGVVRYLSGLNLDMAGWVSDPASRTLYVRSEDTTGLVLGDGGDPTALLAAGGEVRIVAIGGDWFEGTYPLPAAGWRLLDPLNPRAGVRYREAGAPISLIVFEAGSYLRISGGGALLPHTLLTEPDLVQVELRLGSYRYCLEFGGSTQHFTPDERLVRRNTLRALGCPIDFGGTSAQ